MSRCVFLLFFNVLFLSNDFWLVICMNFKRKVRKSSDLSIFGSLLVEKRVREILLSLNFLFECLVVVNLEVVEVVEMLENLELKVDFIFVRLEIMDKKFENINIVVLNLESKFNKLEDRVVKFEDV